MDAVTELKQKIQEMEKSISLRQIALRSGVNYITLRNIKFGKSSRVTDGVHSRLMKFYGSFKPGAKAAAPAKRGRKKGSKNKATKAAAPKPAAKPKKRGRKPGRPRKAAPSIAPKPADSVVAALNKEIAEMEKRAGMLKKFRDDYMRGMK